MSAVVDITPEPRPRGRAVATVATTPLDIIQAALKTGNLEMYKEAIALAKDMDAFAARKAFDRAMAEAVFPIIKKNRAVDFTSPKGRTYYKHEDLAEVLRTVVPVLAENGLSHRYRVTSNINEPVTVTCIISHRDGYFEETTLCAGKDDTGGKNQIQQVGSTITYLQRMTLKAALGLAASDDDDGRSSEADAAEPAAYVPPAGSITQAEADQIGDLLQNLKVNQTAFLAWAGQKRIEDIPADIFESCIEKINEVGAQRK